MRKALVVGLDYYAHVGQLFGCVSDSHAIKSMLDRHADGSVNFGVKHIAGSSEVDQVTRAELRNAVEELFSGEGEVALFYFAGHGYIEATGGFLCSSDVRAGSDGVALAEIMTMANQSKFQNRVIVLDSCHSGVAGGSALNQALAEISDGVTILTASTAEQYASEENGEGVFTSLLVDALGGSAGNLVGDVTPGGVYAHVDQSLGPWAQRPVFKTNVQRFVSLRKVQSPLEQAELRRISEFFTAPGHEFQLDPTYEPERGELRESAPKGTPEPNPENNAVFAILQKYNRVGLVVPVDAPHMYHAAMESKAAKLTALGEHYRRLAAAGLI